MAPIEQPIRGSTCLTRLAAINSLPGSPTSTKMDKAESQKVPAKPKAPEELVVPSGNRTIKSPHDGSTEAGFKPPELPCRVSFSEKVC
jgi:hypothetical protein